MTTLATLHIHAYGVPQVQGNHRIGGSRLHPKIRDANPGLPAWREQLAYQFRAEQARRRLGPFAGPVLLEVTFWLHRPASAPKTIDVWPVTRGGGDWDKLARAIGDAAKEARVIGDDSQIVDAHVVKRYAVGPHLPKIYREGFHSDRPGAQVRLYELPEEAS